MPDAGSRRAGWDRADFRIAAGYLAYFAAVGALIPFAALYFRTFGFSGLQVGVLTALPSLGLALFAPFWGAVADGLGIHRWLMCGSLGTAAIVAIVATQASTFLPVLLLFGLLAFVSVPVAPLIDSYGVTASEYTGRSYGSIRVWGPVGYMGAVLVVGWLMGDETSPLLLVAHAVFLTVALVAVFRLPDLNGRRRDPMLAGLRDVVLHPPVALLLLVVYLVSIGSAIITTYLGVRIGEVGGSARLVGVAFAVASATELPVIALGGWLLMRLGATRLMAVAIGIFAVRLVAFAVLTSPTLMLPVQLFHGLSHAAFTFASITLIHRLAGQRQAATAQALLTSVSLGFGTITGSLVGGILLDAVGTEGIFILGAGLMAFALAALSIGNRVVGFEASAQEQGG